VVYISFTKDRLKPSGLLCFYKEQFCFIACYQDALSYCSFFYFEVLINGFYFKAVFDRFVFYDKIHDVKAVIFDY